jgi:hypothetical protein
MSRSYIRGSLRLVVATLFLVNIFATLGAFAQGTPNVIAKFGNAGLPNADSIMFDNGTNVGIGTTNPTQRLALGSGNILLPNPIGGVQGNLYFGGITDVGQIGLRLFGGFINNQFQSGFIDVRAGTLTDGLIFRVDTFFGGAERMRINAAGNLGINTSSPTQKLDVAGTIRSSVGGFMFPDGTTQSTATLRGPQGPTGPRGAQGPAGPPTTTSAVCVGPPNVCSCSNRTISFARSDCTVTSDTGTCSAQSSGPTGNLSQGACCVCAP